MNTQIEVLSNHVRPPNGAVALDDYKIVDYVEGPLLLVLVNRLRIIN